MKIYTIRDIAKLAGVSVTTVSRVLNHRPDVNAATREKVERVMAECNFVGNANARSLKQLDGDVAALILRGRSNPFLSQLAETMLQFAAETGVSFFLETIDEKDDEFQTALRLTHEKRARGFIFVGSRVDSRTQVLRGLETPLVFATVPARELALPRVASVAVDDRRMGRLAMETLIQAGHRQIAGIFVYDNYQSIEKFQGTAAAMLKRGVEFQDDYIKWCVSDEAHDQRFARSIDRFLKGLPKYTAIVCCNYMIYRLVRQVLEEQGRRVPEDCSLVCFDYSGNDWEAEGITCSVHQGRKVGQLVATRLMTMIERRDCDDKNYTYVMKPKIYIGTSIREL